MRLTRRDALVASLGALGGCSGGLAGSGASGGSACSTAVADAAEARLGFAGDAMLGRSLDEHWGDPGRDPSGIWNGTVDALDALDGLVLNLECCLSTRGSPRPGRTYHFRADPAWAIPALEAAGTSFASLANNHVLDFGPAALADTVDALGRGGIAHAGAGPNLDSAVEPAVLEAGDLTVAVVAFTDRSPSYAAGATDPGTAFVRIDPRSPATRRLVAAALERARERDPDLLVASLHWGPNWVVEPADRQRRFARWLVERGVDVVHGHSAHVIQGVEVYRGRPILYDCGDVVDDYVVKEDLHNDRSLLFELVVADGRLDHLRLVPVVIDDLAVHPAGADAAAWLRERARSLSGAFDTPVERDGDGLVVPLSC